MDEDKMKIFSQMRSRMTTPLCLHEHETSFTGQGGELKFKAHLGKVPLLCQKPKPKPKQKKTSTSFSYNCFIFFCSANV